MEEYSFINTILSVFRKKNNIRTGDLLTFVRQIFGDDLPDEKIVLNYNLAIKDLLSRNMLVKKLTHGSQYPMLYVFELTNKIGVFTNIALINYEKMHNSYLHKFKKHFSSKLNSWSTETPDICTKHAYYLKIAITHNCIFFEDGLFDPTLQESCNIDLISPDYKTVIKIVFGRNPTIRDFELLIGCSKKFTPTKHLIITDKSDTDVLGFIGDYESCIVENIKLDDTPPRKKKMKN